MADVKMAGSDIKKLKPEPKFVLFSQGKIRMYQPKPDQVTEFDLGKNRADLETYVVLGFGGSGQDLVKTFDVTYVWPGDHRRHRHGEAGTDSESRRKFAILTSRFFCGSISIAASRCSSKSFSRNGNYRLAKYSSIQVNEKKIPDDVFKLKTTGKTQTISPGG